MKRGRVVLVEGLILSATGLLQPVQLYRPASGGLNLIAEVLGCNPASVTSVDLDGWIQLWFCSASGEAEQSPLPQLGSLVEALGGVQGSYGGWCCLLLGTVPHKFSVESLSNDQRQVIETAWRAITGESIYSRDGAGAASS